MVEKPSKLQPALVGGLIAGLLSSIPFINWVNICCCLWILLGGVVAARMLIKRSPVLPVTSGEGATAGALAGLVGAAIYLVIGVPLALLTESLFLEMVRHFVESMNNPQASAEFERRIREMQNQPLAQKLAMGLINFVWYSVVMVGFSTVGGIIGVALFEKRKGQPPPGYYPQGFAPPAPPAGPPVGPPLGNAPPPNEPPYGGGEPPPY
ncbi:MAG TPA: hypothetical protein VNH22_01050 [Blastocatellia bacterium]|jgi:hypothetical protein|nr:hypothetical protein [Blastocatellia bacterium]